VYLETHCIIGSKTGFYHLRTLQVTQLFTYLPTRKLFSSCIRRYLVSRAATEWCQRYLPCYLRSVSNSVCFSSIYRSLGRTRAISMALSRTSTVAKTNIGQYRTTDVAENLGKSLSGAQRISPRKDFELILTLKVETRLAAGGPFGRECSAFLITAELWWPEVARSGNFAFFKMTPLKLSLLRGSRLKYARTSPPNVAYRKLFQISSKSVHFRRSYCRMREVRFSAP